MSTDFYQYEGRTSSLIITIFYYDYMEPKYLHINSIADLNGDEMEIDEEEMQKIIRGINEGKVPLKYLGGHNYGGEVWGPDNIRHGIGHDYDDKLLEKMKG